MFQQGGSLGRAAAFGMKVDASNRLWVAGGPQGTVSILDLGNASVVATIKGPQDRHMFLNDLAAAGGHVYVTDSFRPILFRIAATPGAPAALEPWLDLAATPIRYVPNEINLNGIVASPDGRWLLAVQQITGQLWRIDTASKAVTEVRVEGGDLKFGDGLLLRGGNELYVLRNQPNEIVRLQLADGWGAARVVQRIADARLKYPTTAAATERGLMVVNAQLDKMKDPPPLLPFDVLTLAWPR
jgi:Cu-Zn family superoxide dismutase